MNGFGIWFSVFLMTAPLFKIYNLFFSSVTLADGILILFFLSGLFFLLNRKIIRIHRLFLFYAGFVFFQFVMVCIWNQTEEFIFTDVLFRTLRYVFFFLVLAFLVPNFFHEETAVKTMKTVAAAATGYLFLQKIILLVSGMYLPGYLPGIPLSRPEMAEHATVLFQYDPRPRSIFEEPSHYAFYVLMAMALILGKNKFQRRERNLLVFLGLGILLSASSTGIIAMAALFFIWIFLSGGKKQKKAMVIGLLSLPFLGLVLIRIPAFQVFLERMAKGTSSSQHLGAYGILFRLKQNGFSVFLGNGMIDTTTYGFLPSYCRVYYYYGIAGVLLVVGGLLYLVFFVKRDYLYLGILFLILCISGTELFGIQVFLIFPYLSLSKQEREYSMGIQKQQRQIKEKTGWNPKTPISRKRRCRYSVE